MKTENERLISKIILLRKQHNMTQEELAEKIEMARNNYSRLEAGKHEIRIPTLTKILDVFDLELDFKPKQK